MSELTHLDAGADWLAHHGIQGQKWGVQNGPPYPIEPGDHSAAEKKAMSKASEKYDKYVSERNKYSDYWNDDEVSQRKLDSQKKKSDKAYAKYQKAKNESDELNKKAGKRIVDESVKKGTGLFSKKGWVDELADRPTIVEAGKKMQKSYNESISEMTKWFDMKSSNASDEALAAQGDKMNSAFKNYMTARNDLGRSIAGEYADEPLKAFPKSYNTYSKAIGTAIQRYNANTLKSSYEADEGGLVILDGAGNVIKRAKVSGY